MAKINVLLISLFVTIISSQEAGLPPYIKQRCHSSNPKVTSCLLDSLHHVRPFLVKGIPEIQMPSVDPFKIDQLSISLSTGPQGYKVTLRDVDLYGASNFSVTRMKFMENGKPFQARIKFPSLKIESRYTSSGVLFIIPASGGGNFHGILDGVSADIRGLANTYEKKGDKYLNVKSFDMELVVKKVRLSVSKIFNNNRILVEATNLFLRENGHEVLKAMLPQLKTQLSKEFLRIVNQLLVNVPIKEFYIED